MVRFETKKCKKCGYRMTKLFVHHNNSKSGYPHWIPICWFCVDCNKIGDRIRKYDMQGWIGSTKLYRRSNRVNEPNFVVVGNYNGMTDKVEKIN